MKAKRFLSVLASFMILVTAVPASSMAANVPSGSAKASVSVKMYSAKSTVRSVSGVYTVNKMPYRYNATTAAAITIKGNRNQN
ncbi:MAG TPA: hypothetical protein VHR42_06365, partial [Clostridia bacterium]|nr:hypothetical protein [Clostridia bacterium]